MIDFPNNPIEGTTYTYEGIKYTFKDTGSGGYWYLKDLGTATAASTADVDAGTDDTKYVTSDSLSGSTYDTRITDNENDITSLSNNKANVSGTYSGLRAQSTTKDDVGLGNVPNYGISNSSNSTSTTSFASSRAVNNAREEALAITTGTNEASTNLAVGSYVTALVYSTARSDMLRNYILYNDSSDNFPVWTTRASGNTAMQGTWKHRGITGPAGNALTVWMALFQRIS